MQKIKLMIAEDHPLYREALARDLATDKISITGTAANGLELMELIEKNLPDIVLLDLRMPKMNGLEVLKILRSNYGSIKTIVLSMDYSEFMAADLIIKGVAGYLNKQNTTSPELEKVIERVHNEGFFFSDSVCVRILEQLKSEKRFSYVIEEKKYSPREIEVLRLLCAEKSIRDIAHKLNITPHTVVYHKRQLFEKTESTSVLSLVKFAVRQCIISGREFS